MSMLKRLLVEDLVPLFRRKSTRDSKSAVSQLSSVEFGTQVTKTPSPRAVQPGMKVVILNWRAGENDPFTVANATIREHFRACGKNVEIVEISVGTWPSRLTELAPTGVEFAFTWQGLGSPFRVGDTGKSLWEHLRIPLICVHGDHPSHMPLNHQLESRYCFHLYTNAEFARYSNRHFRRARSAGVIDIPQLHREPRLARRAGDFFVIAKNVYDPVETEKFWQQRFGRPVFDAYMMAAETVKSRIRRESYVDIHDVLDDLIAEHGLDWLDPATDIAAYHQYHSQVDLYLRSYKTITAVASLREFPVRIYGRGWDRIARNAPTSHVFEPGRNMADSQELYYTRFGLIDVSPSKGLHDRTRRAMVNGTGFLSSANLEDSFTEIARFASLFFTFRAHELPERCSTVMRDPDGHQEMAQRFANLYHDRFHFREFVNRIDHLAKLAGMDSPRFERAS